MDIAKEIKNFSDLNRILERLIKNREWLQILMLLKKNVVSGKISLTGEQRFLLISVTANAEKSLARLAEKRALKSGNDKFAREAAERYDKAILAWREVIIGSAVPETRLSAIRGVIGIEKNKKEIISLHNRGLEEIRLIEKINNKTAMDEIRTELSFAAGCSIKESDIEAALAYFFSACEKVNKKTILSVLIWNEMASCHLLLSEKLHEEIIERGNHKSKANYCENKKMDEFIVIEEVKSYWHIKINIPKIILGWKERYI